MSSLGMKTIWYNLYDTLAGVGKGGTPYYYFFCLPSTKFAKTLFSGYFIAFPCSIPCIFQLLEVAP